MRVFHCTLGQQLLKIYKKKIKKLNMYSTLSTEVLKQHEASARIGHVKQPRTHADSSRDLSGKTKSIAKDSRSSRMEKQHSDTASMLSQGTGKMKFMRLRHKIKLFGGTFSKSGSDTHLEKRYEPTYQLGPSEKTKFSSDKAEQIIKATLEAYLKEKKYDAKKFPALCRSLSELIKERVKAAGFSRYKLVSYVLITENQGQSARCASRCLWQSENDNFATATYESDDFTAVGSIFATYYD